MKKSLFGLSAKVAMAVLAVCSFVLTSCYEKQAPTPQADPVYYVVGTVYDATTSEAINATVTVNSNAVTVSNGSFITKVSSAGAVTVAAEAAGYVSVSRTVQVAPAGYNQVSVTTADIAMVPVGEEVPESSVKAGNLSADELVAKFGFPEGLEMGEEGMFAICEQVDVESHNGHDAHASFTHNPYPVEFTYYKGGYIWDFASVDAVIDNVMETICNSTMNSALLGKSFAKFETAKDETILNEDGEQCLLCYYVHYNFKQVEITYVFDGVAYVATCVAPVDTTLVPVYDTHDTHDGHDTHGFNADPNHNGSGSGGGEGNGDAE